MGQDYFLAIISIKNLELFILMTFFLTPLTLSY
jgi:hypothetical protein